MKHFLTSILLQIAVFTFANPKTDEKINDPDVAVDVIYSVQDFQDRAQINKDNDHAKGFCITSYGSPGLNAVGTAIGHGETVRTDTGFIVYANYQHFRGSDFDLAAQRGEDRGSMRVCGTEGSGETLQGNHRVLSFKGYLDTNREYPNRAGSTRIFKAVPMAWIPSEFRPVGFRGAKNL